MITEKRKEQEIISVLAPDHRKRIGKSKARDRSRNHELIFVSKKNKKKKTKKTEILISGPFTKGFKEDPEGLANAIGDFNADLCVEAFLNELQSVLPSDDDVSSFQ